MRIVLHDLLQCLRRCILDAEAFLLRFGSGLLLFVIERLIGFHVPFDILPSFVDRFRDRGQCNGPSVPT